MSSDVLRYTAFTTDPASGNPAGIVLDAAALDEPGMQRIAAEVGYSETAFLRATGEREYAVRYFSPEAEVPFCGHATIATAVALAERVGLGELLFATQAGPIKVDTDHGTDGRLTATLTSVPTRVSELDDESLGELLAQLGWTAADLDSRYAPRVAYAGAHHPVLVVRSRERLSDLDYDFAGLRTLMGRRGWTTVQLVWPESESVYHVRNPFPVGGVVEDPATGAAAAAFGGYLRSMGLVSAPATLTLHQGADMGRPSLLTVTVPADSDSIRVTGNAVAI